MRYFFTTWIYPLRSPIVLRDRPHCVLDNARSEEEVQEIASILDRTCKLAGFFPPTAEEGTVSLNTIISNFRKHIGPSEPQIDEVLIQHTPDKVFESLARIWVIARYDDEGERIRLQKKPGQMRKDGQGGVIILDDDDPLIRNSTNLHNYLSLMALLINSEGKEYFGSPILVSSAGYEMSPPILDHHLWLPVIGLFGIACSRTDVRAMIGDDWAWMWFPFVRKRLTEVRDSLLCAFDNGHEEPLMYIGNVLRVVGHEARDIRVRFLLLVSLLELLLTHNPDTTRYNVEDSVSRQFRFKTAVVVHRKYPDIDLSALERRLKELYSLRSAIAHGNFKEITKFEQNLCKKKSEEEYFDDVVTDAYFYLRAVLEEYLSEPEFIRFLKKS